MSDGAEGLFGALSAAAVAAVTFSSGATWGAVVAGAAAGLSIALGLYFWRDELTGRYAVADNAVQALSDEVLYLLVGAPAGIAGLVLGVYAFEWTWWGSTVFGFATYLAALMAAIVIRNVHPDNPAGILVPTFLVAWGRTAPTYAWRRRWLIDAIWRCWIAWELEEGGVPQGRAALVWRQDARRLPRRIRRHSRRQGGIPPYCVECLVIDADGHARPVDKGGVATAAEAEALVKEWLGSKPRETYVGDLPTAVLDTFVASVRRGS